MPKVSVVVPIHNMAGGDFFLWRLVNSLLQQTYTNYELIITKEGKMAHNTNVGINKATGDLIKILYLDDYFAHKDALKNIVENFKRGDHWLVTGCVHQKSEPEYFETPHSPHYPEYTEDIHTGNNKIGSPSVLTFRREVGYLLFDEKLSWLLDADLYRRLHEKWGPPKILNDLNIVIGVGAHQTTYNLSDRQKLSEHEYLQQKYV